MDNFLSLMIFCCYIYIQIYSSNENENELVVGNLNRTKPNERTTHANENISVIESEVDDSESVTLQADKSCVPDDGGVKEGTFDPPHLSTGKSGNVLVASAHSPQIWSPLHKQCQSPSIPTGKCTLLQIVSCKYNI